MAYTQDLINEVKEIYPDDLIMILHAESGSAWLGRYLCDSAETSISIEKILSATSLDELREQALLLKRKHELYKKWKEQDPRKK